MTSCNPSWCVRLTTAARAEATEKLVAETVAQFDLTKGVALDGYPASKDQADHLARLKTYHREMDMVRSYNPDGFNRRVGIVPARHRIPALYNSRYRAGMCSRHQDAADSGAPLARGRGGVQHLP